jgi:hypothetical protein
MERIDPVQGILTILDEASFTGTNKFSLLLAILDLAPLADRASHRILVDDIVEETFRIHWNHTAEFAFPDGPRSIRQISVTNREQLVSIKQIEKLQSKLPPGTAYEFAQQRLADSEWHGAKSAVRKSLLRMPIEKLQNLRNKPVPFLYEVSADKTFLLFFEGVLDKLTEFGGVLRPIVELHYLKWVMNVNKADPVHADLHSFLFGEDRHMPDISIRRDLWEIQKGKCVYTGTKLSRPESKAKLHIDHVLPWSRMRISVLENFTLTNESINMAKGALLLDLPELERWRIHLSENHDAMKSLSGEYNWPTNIDRVLLGMRSLYSTEVAPVVWGQERVQQLTETEQAKALEILNSVDCID